MNILLTGGVKTGKSRRALDIAKGWGVPVTFIATAAITDDEISARVARHKAERADLHWRTIEEQLAIDQALADAGDNVLLDCLPMWVNNLFYHHREDDFQPILAAFVAGLAAKKNCAIVTNETGLGNIPFDALTRRYNLLLAQANREIASACDHVEILICGIPLKVK
jgi:adenosylcobinamide kinase/adenosylcobinamide-phosphate guanylyltransferase